MPLHPVLANVTDEVTDVAQRYCDANPESLVCRTTRALLGEGAVTSTIAQILSAVLPVLFEVAVILVVAVVVNRLARRAIRRFVGRLADDRARRSPAGAARARGGVLHATGPIDLRRARQRTETIGAVLRSLTTAVVYGFAFVLVLGAVGIALGPLVAGAGIAGVALGFGAQNVVKDLLAGGFILLEDQYGIGDIVTIDDQQGIGGSVEAITLRVTRLRDIEGTVWWVPNGEIRRLGNKSQLWARSLLDIPVAYGTDTEHASDVIKRVADSVWRDDVWADKVVEEPEIWGVENYGPSEVVLRLVVKVEPATQWAVNREIRRRLLRAFADEGIEIPFPQRTLWIRGEGEGPGRGDGAASTVTSPRRNTGATRG